MLPTAVRVWTTRPTVAADDPTDAQDERRTGRAPKRRHPAEALVFDTETRDETSQRLLLGVWRVYRDDAHTGTQATQCIEEGVFYPDDLPERDPTGWETLKSYVAEHHADVAPGFPPELALHPLSWWLEERLYRYGAQHRNRCAIVGFNLPFDLGALANYWAPAKGPYRGGWSLGVWGHFDDGHWHDARYHPRILARAIDPRRTLFGWGSRADPDKPELLGQKRFVDLRTLTFALTDRSHTLETACAAFGDPYQKPEVVHGIIDEPMLNYAREDVRHTALLYRNCLTELARHEGVDLQPQALYSPASVGAAYLHAMGLTPPLQKFSDLDPRVLGWSMAAFYGGRAEARIVRTPVPVVVADFTSMYPAQNALLDTWPILTAAQLNVDDVTDQVRTLLAAPDLVQRLFDAATWRQDIGVTLVQVDRPEGVILPVRAGYEPGARDYRIGVNPLSYDGQLWYALPDVLAAALLGDTPIEVSQAIRLRADELQVGLRRVMLRGQRSVDPGDSRNPFVAMIEERHRVKHADDIDPAEKDRLDRFLKITANATAYGSLARFDRKNFADPVEVAVYGFGDSPFPDRTCYPEDPGPYCFPPVAAAITAGARLMLALIERALRDLGGAHAFMDTDSIAIVATPAGGDVPCRTATGTSVRALSHDQVRGLLRRFDTLNPYGPDVINDDPRLGRSPWKVEHDSLTQPVCCYAIASKRYALYRQTAQGPQLVQLADAPEESDTDSDTGDGADADELADWSEHGLGLYLDPTDEQERDPQRRRVWVRDAWQWFLTDALTDTTPRQPPWADRYAVTQFSVSTPTHAGWFRTPETGGYVAGKPRPFGFGLLGHVDPFAANWVEAHPAAPYDKDPRRWAELQWYDRHTGQPVTTVSTAGLADDPSRLAGTLAAKVAPLRTIADILRTHGSRAEHKSLQPDGAPATGTTTGQLTRRPIRSAAVLTAHIGKEGNRLLERATGEITDPADYRTTYTHPTTTNRWRTLTLPVLQDMRDTLTTKELANRLGISDRQLRNWLAERDRPHAAATQNRQRADRVASEWAAQQLRAAHRAVPADQFAALYAFCVTPADKDPSPSDAA